jgi:hypothetical protein
MIPLSGGRELLEAAVSYALAGAAMATAPLLSRPTPCPVPPGLCALAVPCP